MTGRERPPPPETVKVSVRHSEALAIEMPSAMGDGVPRTALPMDAVPVSGPLITKLLKSRRI